MQLKIKNSKPKKSLGQNFLTSVGAVEKIIETAAYASKFRDFPEVGPPKSGGRTSDNITILEVGPGRGVLTEALLKKFHKVIAIEKDDQLFAELSKKFSGEINSQQLRLVSGDILELDARELGLLNGDYGVVANIPYYITGQFLRTWLETEVPPKFMVLMLQKEVAKRIVAKDGKESLLSISIKAYGKPKYVETVKRGSFYPIPNVDSAILLIDHISKLFFDHLGVQHPSKIRRGIFFDLLKAGFSHKRKLLIRNLEEKLKDKEKLQKTFKICNLDIKIRAEDIKTEDWICLSDKLF